MKKSFAIGLLLCCGWILAAAQCPDRPALYARILYLKDSSRPSPDEQLKELQAAAMRMEKCRYTNDTVYAFLLRRIGILYFLQKDLTRAVATTRSAIDVLHRTANVGPGQLALANCYLNLSLYYKSLGMSKEKNDARDSCILQYMTWPDSLDARVLQVIFERVDDLFNTGDYYGAIYYADIANILKVRDSELSRSVLFTILTDKLNALNFLKEYQQCRQTLEEHQKDFTRPDKPNDLGKYYSIRADIAKGSGQYTEALQHFKAAYAIHAAAAYPQGCTQTLNDIGFLYLSEDPEKAKSYFRAALAWKDSVESINILDNIATACVRLRQYDSAFYYFRKGLDQLAPGLSQEDLLSYPFAENGSIITYLVELLLNKADASLELAGQRRDPAMLQQAIKDYSTTDRLLDRVRGGQGETGSKLFWQADNHRLYDRAIAACYAAHDSKNAYYFFEKSRAVLLNDRLLQLSRVSQEALQLQARAQRKVLSLEKDLAAVAGNSPRRRSLQEAVFRARQQLQVLSGTISNHLPIHSDRMDPVGEDIGKVQQLLGREGFTLVELFAGDSALYTLTLTGAAARMARIPKEIYDSLVQRYSTGLANAQPTRAALAQQQAAARQLYSLLFPDQDHLFPAQGPLPSRVIISPDGPPFPFESLQTNGDAQPTRFFIEDHAVSYTYSVRYWQHAAADTFADARSRNFLGMAPVNYAAYQQLPALMGSDRSLTTLRSYFRDGEEMTGANASLHNFQKNFYKYQVLQLYTHASSRSGTGHPMIYFADSALSLSDLIPESRPLTQLVVLSACETAAGDFHRGEGVFSFSREFAALGIPASIANLWSVDDQATYRLTELFFKYLSSGDPSDIALQKAKKEFLRHASRQQQLPYYWAAPVLTGRATTLAQHGNHKSWLIDLLIITLVIGILISFGRTILSSRK